MDNRQLPLALFVALVVAAVPAQAGAALPPSSITEVVEGGANADSVDDATLADMTGRYLGNDMLVGLRVELVSTWQAADGGGPGNMNGLSCEMMEADVIWSDPARRNKLIAITADFIRPAAQARAIAG